MRCAIVLFILMFLKIYGLYAQSNLIPEDFSQLIKESKEDGELSVRLIEKYIGYKSERVNEIVETGFSDLLYVNDSILGAITNLSTTVWD